MNDKWSASRQWLLPLFLISGLVLLLSAAFYLQKRVLPEQIRTVQMNLNIPVRYAFITDKSSAKIAVVDTYENKVVNLLDSTVPAQLLAVSRLGGFLVYAENAGKTTYQLDLETLKSQPIMLEKPLSALSVSADGQIVVAVSKQQLAFIKNRKVVKRITLNSEAAVTFSADGKMLFVAEKASGSIWRYDLLTLSAQVLVQVKGEISAVSISSDNRGLFFTGRRHGKTTLYRYDLPKKQLTEQAINSHFMRPYLSSDDKSLLIVGKAALPTLVYQLNPDSLLKKKQYALASQSTQTNEINDNIRTGWLEQIGLVAMNNALYSFVLDDAENTVQVQPLSGNIRSMLVSADSKTLLATVGGSQALLVYDVRSQSLRQRIDLPLTQPDNVVMGQTNTLCH